MFYKSLKKYSLKVMFIKLFYNSGSTTVKKVYNTS